MQNFICIFQIFVVPLQPKTYKTMKKFFIFCLIPLLFAGCKIKVEGPYSETVYVSLPQNHSAKVHFTRKNGKISTHLFLNKNKDLACSQYGGSVKYLGDKKTYVFSLQQLTVYKNNLSKKELSYYTDPKTVQMEVTYSPQNESYQIRLSGSKCPAMQMSQAQTVANGSRPSFKEEFKHGSFWRKVECLIGEVLAFTYTSIQNIFDRTLGKLDFSSRWMLLFYLGGLLIMGIGLQMFMPLCWIGVIMTYAYLQYMTPPFFMLWPSLVGWGWMIVSLIPMVIAIVMHAMLCVGLILKTFTNGFINFLIMLIPAFIAVLSLVALVNIAFNDHIELIAFFILGTMGGGKKVVGYFIDNNGNVHEVVR